MHAPTKTQQKIERIHQRLMDLRDSTPYRRGHVTAEREYTRVYMRAYKTNRVSDFYAAAEKYRHFLQDKDGKYLRLVAAAPHLLKALKKVFAQMQEKYVPTDHPEDHECEWCATYREIENAIARTEAAA